MTINNIHFHDEIRNFPQISLYMFSWATGGILGALKRGPISHGRQAIGV